MVVELELGAAVGVGGVDPFGAAAQPVAGVAASVIAVVREKKTKTYEYYNEHGRPGYLPSSLNSAREILLLVVRLLRRRPN